jgi:hypothetical protein
VPNPGRTKILESGDTFFTVNYGGGIKFLNLAGPLGFRVDVHGTHAAELLPRNYNMARTYGRYYLQLGRAISG